jgi:hypothetical protein
MTRPAWLVRSGLAWRGALGLFGVGLLLRQTGLAALVFGLGVVWLRMPDASGLEVACSGILAIVILAVAGFGESALCLRLCNRERTYGRLVRGAAVFLSGVVLWLAWGALLNHVRGNDTLDAGYLNSRVPRSMRYFFTYERLALWLGWMWTALDWIGAGILAVFAVCTTASVRPIRAARRALASMNYWVATLAGVTVATLISGLLVEWTPGHGLRIEALSLVLRLGAVVLIDASVACLLLAILAASVRQSDEDYTPPGGTPAESQPRTAESP